MRENTSPCPRREIAINTLPCILLPPPCRRDGRNAESFHLDAQRRPFFLISFLASGRGVLMGQARVSGMSEMEAQRIGEMLISHATPGLP